jgi:crossover junction endodeoxyribonuclease RusA
MTVTLGWPPRVLWPNGRAHWSEVARQRQAQRSEGYYAAHEAGLRGVVARGVRLTFHAPDARRRDTDNMLAAMKAGLDGIADAMGQDDSEWAVELQRGPVMRPGRVVVEVLV